MKKIFWCMFLLLVSGFTLAQDKLSWETYYERLTDVDGIESGSWEACLLYTSPSPTRLL